MNFKWDKHTELALTARKVSYIGGCVGQAVAHRVDITGGLFHFLSFY